MTKQALMKKVGAHIPIHCRTIVITRSTRSGLLRTESPKAIVLGACKPDDFSRAYGKQVYLCAFFDGKPHISTCGAADLWPVGRAKRIPQVCKDALAEHQAYERGEW